MTLKNLKKKKKSKNTCMKEKLITIPFDIREDLAITY